MCPEDCGPSMAGPDGNDVVDLKLISDIIVLLNIVRKNTRIYPAGHPRMKASLERVLDLLDQHFAYADRLHLGITRDSLLVGDRELPPTNPIFAEFAKRLHDRSVFSLCLLRGIDADELLAFNQSLSPFTGTADAGEKALDPDGTASAEAPEEEPAEGLITCRLVDPNLAHVRIGIMDWDSYESIEVDEIDIDARKASKEKGGITWEKYVRHLMEKDESEAMGTTDEGVDISVVDPAKLAAFLKKLEKRRRKEQSYDNVIATYMREASASRTSLDTVRDPQVRQDFVSLANELNPGLRKEILSELFKFSRRAPNVAVQLLDKTPFKVVLSVLAAINTEGRKVDNKVFGLVDKLSPADALGKPLKPILDELAQDEEAKLRDLAMAYFTAKDFPVSGPFENRNEMLEEMALDLKGVDPDKSVGPDHSLETEVEQAINPLFIGEHTVFALLDLLEHSTKPEFAEVYASAIADIMNEYIHLKHFDLVVRIWNELDMISAANAGSPTRLDDFCRKAQVQFWHPENISLMASAILVHGLSKAEELTGILLASGAACTSQIVEVLGLQDNKAIRRTLIKIVAQLREQALPYVIKSLNDDNWYVVRNMLMVIQELRDVTALNRIRQLVEHEEPDVRLEALKTLVLLGHSEANALLMEHFDDPDKEIAHGAIAIAGLVPDETVVQALVGVVCDRKLFNKDFGLARRVEAVKALARRAPPHALPELFKMVSAHRLFSKKEFEKLNVAIFKSLAFYDPEKIDMFIHWGQSSKDMEIVNICKSLQDRTMKKTVSRPQQPAPGGPAPVSGPRKPAAGQVTTAARFKALNAPKGPEKK